MLSYYARAYNGTLWHIVRALPSQTEPALCGTLIAPTTCTPHATYSTGESLPLCRRCQQRHAAQRRSHAEGEAMLAESPLTERDRLRLTYCKWAYVLRYDAGLTRAEAKRLIFCRILREHGAYQDDLTPTTTTLAQLGAFALEVK